MFVNLPKSGNFCIYSIFKSLPAGWLNIQIQGLGSATDSRRDQEKIEQRVIPTEGPEGLGGELGDAQV